VRALFSDIQDQIGSGEPASVASLVVLGLCAAFYFAAPLLKRYFGFAGLRNPHEVAMNSIGISLLYGLY
jgi:hypothetical protein